MRRAARIALPVRRPEDVIPHLGERFHWKQGRSAKALADLWAGATDLPQAIRAMVDQEPALNGAELLDGWLERETDLQDGEPRASQTDLLALLGLPEHLAVLGIQAKAGEVFGPTVYARLSGGSPGVRRRVEQLCIRLGLVPSDAAALRYQLLHRTVAILLEARRFRVAKAVLIVQSFRPDPAGLADFQKFARAIGFGEVVEGRLAGPLMFNDIELWLGWADDDVPSCGLTIGSLRQTTSISPAQWEGALTDGRPIYIRYRWGELSVRIGRIGDDTAQVVAGSPWFEGHVGDPQDSDIEFGKVLRATGLALSPDVAVAA